MLSLTNTITEGLLLPSFANLQSTTKKECCFGSETRGLWEEEVGGSRDGDGDVMGDSWFGV